MNENAAGGLNAKKVEAQTRFQVGKNLVKTVFDLSCRVKGTQAFIR